MPPSATEQPASAPGRPGEIFAWAMYDWANSAYSTLSITILFGYITSVVFQPDDNRGPVVWAWGISLSMLVAALLSPVLGALADANRSKRKWLALTALAGAGIAVVMAFVPHTFTRAVVVLFVLASLMFELSLGFYNGFLPEITDEKTINRVSAWGYALGYLGGALALILALVVIKCGPRLGLPTDSQQLRAGIFIMGLWWGLFTLPTIWVLRDRGRPSCEKLPPHRAVRDAIREVGRTLKNVRRYKMLVLFLIGFLFFNDGIQTVISQASTFATKTKELSFDTDELILLILMIQFLALPGAMFVGYLADWIGQKTTLMLCLAVWVLVVIGAFFVDRPRFWALGVVLAMVLGGTQSISRAIMGTMTPRARTAEFFGFFNFSGKATSFLGTFLFGLIMALTGNPRWAIVSLLIFFLLGWAIVARINVEQGRQQALHAEQNAEPV